MHDDARSPAVTADDIRAAVRRLGLSGRAVCVHASLRSFGVVAGGAAAVIDGFLAEGCTLLVPAFTDAFAIPPPPHLRPARNARDYARDTAATATMTRIYTPDTTEIDRAHMGAIPAAVLAHPNHVRGNHPQNSFAAVGPRAHALIDGQAPLRVYAPFAALVAMDGAIVLMGVRLNRMTFIHYAEQAAGRTLFRRWANGPDGAPMMVETGGCSAGFGALAPVVAPLMRKATVGTSAWTALPARETLPALVAAIRADPRITHCGDAECGRCNDAVRGGPILAPYGDS